jgi:ribosomal peptide maturation radical SAM protein 1
MPFAAVHSPSIALTQLRSVLAATMNGQVETRILYLNHDFVGYFGTRLYHQISNSVQATVSGLGDWLFRQAAFPHLEDNSAEYLQRYAWLLGSDRDTLLEYERLRRGIDAFLDELIDRYQLDRCALVGFTSMFAQNVASFAMGRKLKERNVDLVTVMGGANCETVMGNVIARNVPAIDFVFSGPALSTFPQLVRNLMRGDRDQCHAMKGVFSRSRLDGILQGGLNEIGEELPIDVNVPLDYDDFLASLEEKCPGSPASLLFETSRGCWWGERSHCTFCGLNGTTMSYRAMEPERALEQFRALFRYFPRVTRYESVDNILPRPYLTTVLPQLKPPSGARIFYEIKADLKEHEMQVLAQAGVTEIQPGIEALSTSTLRLMKKGTTSFHNLRFLKNCLTYGINPAWNLLVGFPGEPEDVYRKYVADIPLLVHLPPPSGAYPVRFDRFSPYFTLAKDYGLKLRHYDFYDMVYPFPDQELEDLAYFFADQNYSNAYIGTTARWLKRLEVQCERWNTRWHERDGQLKPTLSFETCGDTRIVRDTRSGAVVRHEISALGLRILERLDDAMKLPRLVDHFPGTPGDELERELLALRERGLLFEEDDRFISLVVDSGRDEVSV